VAEDEGRGEDLLLGQLAGIGGEVGFGAEAAEGVLAVDLEDLDLGELQAGGGAMEEESGSGGEREGQRRSEG